MKPLWRLCGNVAFWLGWPATWLYLRIGTRTRVLVVADNEVLAVKPWMGSGKWILPGGGVHYREDPLAAALRELREETGVVLEPSQPHLLYQATYHEYGFRFPYACYVAQLQAKPKLRKQLLEIVDVTWLNLDAVNPRTCQTDVVAALQAWRRD
jgi:8-oxo-dGTP pyrophosphatase MutT (NUDIX family)